MHAGDVSPGEMIPGCRGTRKEGMVAVQSAPEQMKSVTFRNSSLKQNSLPLPKTMAAPRPVTRSLSTTSLRKTGDWLSHKPYVQLLVDEESREISAMTQCVLDTENLYNQRVNEYVKQAEQAEQCRKEIQHKRWMERVADPLQKVIEKYIDNQSSEDIEKRRRRLLAQYLRYCNKKGSAFMRDYDSSEYDPFINRLYKQYLRVSTPKFQDPLLQQSQKRYEEEKIAMHCETGRVFSAKEIHELNLQKLPQVPLGRHSMNGAEWLKTPFGYIESETRLKSRQRVRGSCNQESLDFKLWTDKKFPPEIFSSEMKISQKRKFPVRPSSLPAYCPHWGPDPADTITV
ncbi:protein FAM228B isoform X1 [Bufo gargarizans]|uniref:protein FAM228B isoform X1 n=2 Tax=Bufo gargarizans TaxID=30331 RepID=UPI001CF11D8D|nr:protein FAM228B isoform X1 [Bufo gargarizans]